MANRLVSNVYIIDSQLSATVPLPWGDGNNIPKMRVSAIGFTALDTTAKMQICLNNSSHTVFNFSLFGSGIVSTAWVPSMYIWPMGSVGVEWQQVLIPTLTAGTGYLYLV